MPRIALKKENAIRRYLRETQMEIKRVTWPSRQDATKLTGIVIAVTLGMTIFLGLVDLALAKAMDLIISLTRGGA